MREMAALGAPFEAITLAVEAIESTKADFQKKEADRLKKQRDRTSKSRALSRYSNDTEALPERDADVTVTHNKIEQNQQLNGSDHLYIDSYLTSSSDSKEEGKKEDSSVVARERKPRANKGQVVPEDMNLSEKNLDFALNGHEKCAEWDRPRAFHEWERYKSNSISKGVLYRNIDHGWRNWVRSPFQEKQNGQRSSNHYPNGAGTAKSGDAAIVAGVANYARQSALRRNATGTGRIPESPDAFERTHADPRAAGSDRAPYPQLEFTALPNARK